MKQKPRFFQSNWTEEFAFVINSKNLPTCLICQETLKHNKKSNLDRHFNSKHGAFSKNYPSGDIRKKAVEELKRNLGCLIAV